MHVKDLKANPKNPRTISTEKLAQLKKSLKEFGDLSGIIYNRSTKQLVGGHQRAQVFDKASEVKIERKYPKPTKTGTVAEGHVLLNGERFKYREVIWKPAKEKAANLAANKNAGEWDLPKLSEWLRDLDKDGFDLSLTMFTDHELEDFLTPTLSPNKPGSVEFTSEEFQEFKHTCPKCGFEFDKHVSKSDDEE